MSPLDKPTGEVTGDVDMDDFGGGSTDGLVSTAGGLWWFKMGSRGRHSGLWGGGVPYFIHNVSAVESHARLRAYGPDALGICP